MRTWPARAVVSLLMVPLTAVPAASAASAQPDARTCAKADLLFCEDFQSMPVGGASSLRWGIDTEHGTLTVERGRRGRRCCGCTPRATAARS